MQETAVENPYGLGALIANGDIIARSILAHLVDHVAADVVHHDHEVLRPAPPAQAGIEAEREFWTSTSLTDALNKLKGASNPFRALAETGKQAYEYHETNKTRLSGAIGTSEWITESLQRTADTVISRMQSGLPVLASVGATAPFVGLLGTVIGIYHALIAIGVAGQASIDKVAGPVGEALIMTAIGLAVAVPAVLGYNILLRRNKGVQEMVSHFTHELHAYLISGAKMGLGMDKAGLQPVGKTAPAAAR